MVRWVSKRTPRSRTTSISVLLYVWCFWVTVALCQHIMFDFCVQTVDSAFRRFVEKELFADSDKPPARHDLTYFPTVNDLQNNIHQAIRDMEAGILPFASQVVRSLAYFSFFALVMWIRWLVYFYQDSDYEMSVVCLYWKRRSTNDSCPTMDPRAPQGFGPI